MNSILQTILRANLPNGPGGPYTSVTLMLPGGRWVKGDLLNVRELRGDYAVDVLTAAFDSLARPHRESVVIDGRQIMGVQIHPRPERTADDHGVYSPWKDDA